MPSTVEATPKAPVFIYSGFRTSSTWVWKKFRDIPEAHAYYEIYNPMLAQLTLAGMDDVRPGIWDSKHPHTAPYFLEFSPLLGDDSVGVPGFSDAFVYRNLIPFPDAKSLPGDEVAYIERLLAFARNCGKVPVITGTRNLGRVGATKNALPGVHIVSVRNLWHQWLSFCNQHAGGNPWFLKTVGDTLDNAPSGSFPAQIRAQYSTTAPASSADAPSESLFFAFVSLHLYLYALAFKFADVVVDVNRLASDLAYRATKQEEIRRATGLPVDFSDVRSKIEYGATPMPSTEVLHAHLESTFASIFNLAEFRDNAAAKVGVRSLIDDLCDEYERYAFYAEGMLKAITSGRKAEAGLRTRCESMAVEAEALRADSDEKERRLAGLQSELRDTRNRLEEVASCCAAHRERVADLERQLKRVPFHTHFYRGAKKGSRQRKEKIAR